jgi:hypothetical protein
LGDTAFGLRNISACRIHDDVASGIRTFRRENTNKLILIAIDWNRGKDGVGRQGWFFLWIPSRSYPIAINLLPCDAFAEKLFGSEKECMIVRPLIGTRRQSMEAVQVQLSQK